MGYNQRYKIARGAGFNHRTLCVRCLSGMQPMFSVDTDSGPLQLCEHCFEELKEARIACNSRHPTNNRVIPDGYTDLICHSCLLAWFEWDLVSVFHHIEF